MKNKVDSYVLIPARSGSKQLKNKNIKLFNGKPLIYWSIMVAKQIKSVQNVFVSTDSKAYAKLAEKFGAKILSLRPKNISTGNTPMSQVLSYHQKQLDNIGKNENIEFCILLDPTSPIRFPNEINNALKILRANKSAAGIVSISVPSFNPLWVSVIIDDAKQIKRWQKSGSKYTRRQDVPIIYRMNGSFYIWRISKIRNLKDPWLSKGVYLPYITKEIYSFSIDSQDDFNLAELMHKKLLMEGIIKIGR